MYLEFGLGLEHFVGSMIMISHDHLCIIGFVAGSGHHFFQTDHWLYETGHGAFETGPWP